jgi:hypothetical protein
MELWQFIGSVVGGMLTSFLTNVIHRMLLAGKSTSNIVVHAGGSKLTTCKDNKIAGSIQPKHRKGRLLCRKGKRFQRNSPYETATFVNLRK